MEIKATKGNAVRIPEPKPGIANAIHRYREERAVILHPTDFHRLVDLERLVMELSALTPIAPSEAAVRAHIESDTPEGAIIDPNTLDELFGE